MIKAISDRPWIWIVFALAAMIAIMTVLVVIAEEHRQTEVPLNQAHIDN